MSAYHKDYSVYNFVYCHLEYIISAKWALPSSLLQSKSFSVWIKTVCFFFYMLNRSWVKHRKHRYQLHIIYLWRWMALNTFDGYPVLLIFSFWLFHLTFSIIKIQYKNPCYFSSFPSPSTIAIENQNSKWNQINSFWFFFFFFVCVWVCLPKNFSFRCGFYQNALDANLFSLAWVIYSQM